MTDISKHVYNHASNDGRKYFIDEKRIPYVRDDYNGKMYEIYYNTDSIDTTIYYKIMFDFDLENILNSTER